MLSPLDFSLLWLCLDLISGEVVCLILSLSLTSVDSITLWLWSSSFTVFSSMCLWSSCISILPLMELKLGVITYYYTYLVLLIGFTCVYKDILVISLISLCWLIRVYASSTLGGLFYVSDWFSSNFNSF